MKNHLLYVEIVRKHGTQKDFASSINEHACTVSRVLRGHTKLTPEKAARWLELLKCDPSIIEEVTVQ